MNRRRGDALSSRYRNLLGGAAIAFLALFLAIPVAHAAENMRITFVRHAESEGNASGLIDTKTPGPVLTEKGQQQARAVVDRLGDNNYDAIYASQMVRTQQTATPLSQYLGLPIQVLPGLQEIEAGVFEGTPEADAAQGYGVIPITWALGLPQYGLPQDMSKKMPGTDLDGYGFDARVDGALKTMYDNGDRNAVVFSHGGTIMFWTMMNAKNLTMTQKFQLLQTAALNNTDYVVIEGNPEDGWIVTDWNGQKFAPEPTFGHELNLQMRTLSRQLQQAATEVVQSFASHDLATIATAINRGIADASLSVTKFNRAVNAEVIKRIKGAFPSDSQDQPDKVSTELKSAENQKAAATTNVVSHSLAPTPAPTGSDEKPAAADKPVSSVSADAPVRSKPESALGGIVKPRGATDLSDGNKALPGQTKALKRSSDKVHATVEDTREQVSASVRNIKDAVKKATGQNRQSEQKDKAEKKADKKDAA